MNNKKEQTDDYQAFLLLDEIAKNNEVTQRDLSKRLGVALGLINSYIKNLISKGHITIASIPKNRYKYFLTPKGLAEKTRLTYHHLQNFTNLYKVARKDFQTIFHKLAEKKVKKVAFCGVDEVAEIAYLSLQETALELIGVLDNDNTVKKFFGYDVLSIKDVLSVDYEFIIITSFQSGNALIRMLREAGVKNESICGIGRGGWLQRIGEGKPSKPRRMKK